MRTVIKILHVFNRGHSVSGKSYLIKAIYHSLTETVPHRAISLEKQKVLLLAPIGVAAINMDRGIPV